MRLLAPALLLLASAALAQPTERLGPNTYAARVSVDLLDGSDRGVGYFQTIQTTADERLDRRGTQVELVVRGRIERRGAFLGPQGPHGARTYAADFEHRWTGEARDEDGALHLHFRHTTATTPPRPCDLTLRCVPDPDVADALRCTSIRSLGHHGDDRLIPSYLHVPLLLGRGRWLVVDAYGRDGEPGTARARPPGRLPAPRQPP